MFRHACGFQLANQGTDTRTLQAYLGHRNIQHTVRYTELSPTRFKNLWRESLVSTSRRTSAHSAASTADGLPFDLQHQRQAPEKALAGGQCSIYALANDELTVNAPSIGQPIDLAGLVSAEYLRHTNRAPRSPIG
jgi:hypothetical protein